ncbi:predicted protein [Plenodomus lingam JN3]|uniref:Uncharacterized protein n=1 Tax=Leptosphaeria maculans (strain JN3 / isolate v23.1.3 / race Av1-4-5-6-7-8) TaxID=985895 RepID=E4ZFX5_LEPMJ|nr:predicted protein [Plenodomus lingam JN3]CBX90195.1 predicted protein [Plenodomus lingam JN3]
MSRPRTILLSSPACQKNYNLPDQRTSLTTSFHRRVPDILPKIRDELLITDAQHATLA